MATNKTTVKTARKFLSDVEKLRILLAGRQAIYWAISELEKDKRKWDAENKAELESLMARVGDQEQIEVNGVQCKVSTVTRTNRSLKAELLLQHGVSQKVIDASTEVSESYYVKVDRLKEEN